MKGKLMAIAVAGFLVLAGPAFAESPQDLLQELSDSFQEHYGFPGATVAFQINTDVGIVDDSTDLVPALADLAIGQGSGVDQP